MAAGCLVSGMRGAYVPLAEEDAGTDEERIGGSGGDGRGGVVGLR